MKEKVRKLTVHTPRSTLLEIDTHKEWKGMHYINKKIPKKGI